MNNKTNTTDLHCDNNVANYSQDAQIIKGKGPIIVKGFWIWWCNKHRQPAMWCERDYFKTQLEKIKQMIKT